MWLCCKIPETLSCWKYFCSCLDEKPNRFLDAFKDKINSDRHENARIYAQKANSRLTEIVQHLSICLFGYSIKPVL